MGIDLKCLVSLLNVMLKMLILSTKGVIFALMFFNLWFVVILSTKRNSISSCGGDLVCQTKEKKDHIREEESRRSTYDGKTRKN